MEKDILSVREIEKKDIEPIMQYWLGLDAAFLHGMGADINKLPDREQWTKILGEQIGQAYEEKRSYCIIWEINGNAIGHSNVNKIIFGEEAFMHLHLWHENARKKGFGTRLVKMTLPFFFKNLQLKTLYCEPYALNPAPNKTLEKAGFEFVREYITIPGMLNFEQPVMLWELNYKRFISLR